MRLLHVHTREFKWFHSDPPPYAILSHRWRESEPRLADVQQWDGQRSEAFAKVFDFAQYVKANLRDIEWIWIDSCCINQDSQSELSRSINRMFDWYRGARVCLAYLSDVDSPSDTAALKSSVWFTRGWTLQELIASKTTVFLTRHWWIIGCKGAVASLGQMYTGVSMEPLLSEVTGVPLDVLHDFSYSERFSAQEKMQWMQGRQTLEEEDMVYALFGILGVAPGPNYGEGRRNAEMRLEEALQRQRRATTGGTPFGETLEAPLRQSIASVRPEERHRNLLYDAVRNAKVTVVASLVSLGFDINNVLPIALANPAEAYDMIMPMLSDPKPYTVVIKTLTGKKYHIMIGQHTTCLQLKEEMKHHEGLIFEDQYLVCNRRWLPEATVLSQRPVRPGDVVHILLPIWESRRHDR